MAKKRLNKKLVLLLSLLAAMTMIGLAMVMLVQLQGTDPERFAELARSATEAEEYEQASLFYHKAWQRSGDPRYLVQRGSVELSAGRINRALQCWRDAVIKDPGLLEARRSELQLELELGRLYNDVSVWIAVSTSAEAMIQADAEKTDEDLAFAYHAGGLALTHLASQDEANPQRGEAQLEQATQLDPNNVEYALDLATQYLASGRVDDGRQRLDTLAARFATPSTEASRIRLALARHLSTVEPFTDAERYFDESIQMAGDDVAQRREAQVGYAIYLTQKWARSVDQDGPNPEAEAVLTRAETVLKEAVKADPDPFEPYEQLSFLYHRLQGRHEDAVNVCEARLARPFSRKGVRAAKDRKSVFQLNIRASRAAVALAKASENEETRKSWMERAEQYLTDAKGEAPNHPAALRQEGELRLAQGRGRAALEAFRAANQRSKGRKPIDWELKKRLAQLHLRMHEPGAALEVLEAVVEPARLTRGKDTTFWLLYANATMETGDLDRALAIVDPMLLTKPDLVGARQLKASILERQGQAGQAGRLVESVATAAILQAKERALEGDTEGALEVLQDAHRQEPGDYRLTGTLVAELVRRDRRDEAAAIIDRARAANPESSQIKALAVWVEPGLSEEQRDARVLEIINQESDAFQRAIDLMDFHLQRDNRAEALTQLRLAEQLLIEKGSPQARRATIAAHRGLIRLKLQIGFLLKDETVLAEARDDAVKYDVDAAGGQTILGMDHMLHQNWQQAATAFRAALQVQSTDAQTMARLGECLIMLGQFDDARTQLERALRINPHQPNAHRGLARLAKQAGEIDALKQHLLACQRLIPNDPWVRSELLYQEEQSDPSAAIARREELLAEHPEDLANLRRLAALCALEGLTEKADRYYKQLLARTPDDKQLVVTVSSYYRTTDRPEQALALVQAYVNAKTTPAERADAHILLASHYVNLGALQPAEAALLEAADLKPTLEVARALGEFYMNYAGDAAEALPWLTRAESLARANDSNTLPSILGAKIQCLLDRGINDPQRAQQELDALLSRYPLDRNAPLLQSEIHARQGDIQAAIASLSQYLNNVPDDTSALFHRAKHFAATGRISAAIGDLQSIKRINPAAIEFKPRLLLAALHFQSGRRDRWVEELESLFEDAPDSELVIGELVKAYLAENRFQDADRLLTGQINRRADRPAARWYALRGQVAFELKDYQRALRDFQRVAELTDYDNASLLSVLDAQLALDKVQDAVAFFEAHADVAGASPALLARYGRLLVQVGKMEKAVVTFRQAMDRAVRTDFRAAGTIIEEILQAMPSADTTNRFRQFSPDANLARANDRILVRLMARLGEMDQAEQLVQQLLDTATTDLQRVQLFEEQGDIFNKAGQPERARQAYEQALALDDRNWVLLNNLAFLLSDAFGDHARALPYARKATELFETKFTLDTLGWIYVGLGRFSNAIAELNQALRLDPGSIETYYHLGEAYRRNGQFSQAKNALARAKEIAESARVSRFNKEIDEALKKAALRTTAP
ncbi:MAG: tetratricopeptide repeat protein [Phycisphaerae bacterium]